MDSRKEAANHFLQYLCSAEKITQDKPYISIDELKSVFRDQYQPTYQVQCLKMNNLVSTFANASLLDKPNNDGNIYFKRKSVNHHDVKKGQFPDKPSSRLSKPKQKLIVSQRYTEIREKHQGPDGVSEEKCDYCKVPLTADTVSEHKKDELHRLRVTYRQDKRSFDDAKHILAVRIVGQDSNQIPPGAPLQVSCRVATKHEINIEFTNMCDEKEIFIDKILALISHKNVNLPEISSMTLFPGHKFSFKLNAQFSSRGAVLYPLIFKIQQTGVDQTKYHLQDIQLLIQSELMDQLAPEQPFVRTLGPVLKLNDAAVLPGKLSERQLHNDLRPTSALARMHFTIPPVLVLFLNNGFKVQESMTERERDKLEDVRALLPKQNFRDSLTHINYAQLFELLLFIEEHQMSRDIHYYDMHDATLSKRQGGLWLKVPGLVDKRPSLLINDTLKLNFVGDRSVEYEGFVQAFDGNYACLGLHDKFCDKYTNQKLDVRFEINRHVLRSMHRALYLVSAHRVQSLFFPSKQSKPLSQPPLRPWFNRDIEKNPEQQAAVRNIFHNSSQNSPYLVFGPPGTGKTVTLVEAIMQLWDPVGKSTRILVCTPSNAAADEITKRLLQTINATKLISSGDVKKHIYRMCALSRGMEIIPPEIKSAGITNHDPRTGLPFYPKLHVIMAYDIVISTFCNSARLVLGGMQPGHFTHIIMDEVGQALEPEALIPLSGLATTPHAQNFCCQVIMAGDPKQLGPIIQSPIAAKFGLDKSILERLMSMPLYLKKPATNRYDSCLLTKLVMNFRSHPAILEVPNKLFYDADLKPCGTKEVIESCCTWPGLAKQGFPLIFHGVEGVDEREGTSPSFFNRQEVEIITDYIHKIMLDGVATNKEIGVVTPYNQQVKKIKKACVLMNLPQIDVGSVEQFQGQERKVILISTVRSRTQFLEFDYLFQLGFLVNPKRFNVAVTRARSLLVIVGNPHVLQHDHCWRTLLKHCIDNGAYVGAPFMLEPLKNDNPNE